MTKLQQIVKRAKEIRKGSPKKFPKWTDYIKAASKQLAGFEGVSKQGNKTAVHYTKKVPAVKKKAAPAKKTVQAKLFGIKKTKVNKPQKINTSFALSQLKLISEQIELRAATITNLQSNMSEFKTAHAKTTARRYIKEQKAVISNLKAQLTIIKKLIK